MDRAIRVVELLLDQPLSLVALGFDHLELFCRLKKVFVDLVKGRALNAVAFQEFPIDGLLPLKCLYCSFLLIGVEELHRGPNRFGRLDLLQPGQHGLFHLFRPISHGEIHGLS